MFGRKGQSIVSDSIGILIAVVVIAGVALPVATEAMVTDTNSVNNETYSPATLPANITVDNVEFGVVEDSETITWVNGSDSTDTAELTEGTDYEVISYEDGTFEIQSYADYNEEDGDYFGFDYDYKPDGYIQNSITRTVVDYIPLALVLSVFMAALAIVA